MVLNKAIEWLLNQCFPQKTFSTIFLLCEKIIITFIIFDCLFCLGFLSGTAGGAAGPEAWGQVYVPGVQQSHKPPIGQVRKCFFCSNCSKAQHLWLEYFCEMCWLAAATVFSPRTLQALRCLQLPGDSSGWGAGCWRLEVLPVSRGEHSQVPSAGDKRRSKLKRPSFIPNFTSFCWLSSLKLFLTNVFSTVRKLSFWIFFLNLRYLVKDAKLIYDNNLSIPSWPWCFFGFNCVKDPLEFKTLQLFHT